MHDPVPGVAQQGYGRPARLLVPLVLALLGAPVYGETLEPILITAPRMERDLLDVPAAVHRVDTREIHQGHSGLTLDEPLRGVPGLFLQNRYNFAQGLRISTRGFGARAPFGIRGIRIRVDGFPETLPDGQSQTDAIDLDSAERIEVIRGPAAVAYGNAAGGVIDITTADGRNTTHSPVLSTDIGSDRLRRAGVRVGGSEGDRAHHASASALRFDGHRDHSETDTRRFNAKLTRTFGRERELQAVLTLLDNPFTEDPGGLTAEELAEDRTAAAPAAESLNAGQTAEQQRLGLRWRERAVAGGELTLRGFYTRRDFEQQLPFPGNSLLGYQRDFLGLGAEYSNRLQIAGRPLDWVVGADLDRQIDDRFRFDVDGNGTVQSRTADERQQATATGLFAQADLGLTDRFDLSAGLRFDRVRFTIDDHLTADGDDSGARRFDETSASLGALYTLAPGHRLYGNVSTAFETPTFTEFADPDGTGGFNPDIEPQQALNRELGLRGRLGGRLRYDLAVFRVDVRDELVSFQQNGRDFFENAARTERDGFELGLDWIATDRLALAAAWTWSEYRFKRFVDRDGNDFGGNRLPGLPEHHLHLQADWQTAGGRFARLEARLVDEVFADNANTVQVDGYAVLDARLGRNWYRGGGRRLEAWIGIDNLTDTEYIANVRVNASADRYFEPAPERSLRAGIEYAF